MGFHFPERVALGNSPAYPQVLGFVTGAPLVIQLCLSLVSLLQESIHLFKTFLFPFSL
jgi:hypothetical protein